MSLSAQTGTEVDQIDALSWRFETVRARTERLAAPLSAEDQMVQSMPDTSPTKWHRAHTTWFFAEFVLGATGASGRIWDRPEYRFLYNSYYDAVGARHPRPDRGMVSRPSTADVADYRIAIDRDVVELLTNQISVATPEAQRIVDTVLLGTHHEEQHQELLLMDIKHALSANPAVGPAYVDRSVAPASDPGSMAWVDIAGGVVEVGVDASDPSFSWDNESPRHEVRVYDVALADRLVTTLEWAAFIEDGGYSRPELWKSDGWHRAQAERWSAPEYWRRDPDEPSRWLLHSLTGVRTLDPFEPVVHISQYEADAFATWSNARLPTEFEWEHAARGLPVLGNFLSDDLDAHAADVFHPRSAGPPTGGLRQMFGDCWEWTSSSYLPYPGFRIADGAIGEYNGKFMSGQNVLRGGCVFTPPGHARSTYRNFFHPHTRWHASGVRLATDL